MQAFLQAFTILSSYNIILGALCAVLQLLCGNPLARQDGVRVQRVLEREQERCCDDTLGNLRANACTYIISLCLAYVLLHRLPP